MLTQLNPPLPMFVPLHNKRGLAHFVLDYGLELPLFWVIFFDETGECWTIRNEDVRLDWNRTYGRIPPKKEN